MEVRSNLTNTLGRAPTVDEWAYCLNMAVRRGRGPRAALARTNGRGPYPQPNEAMMPCSVGRNASCTPLPHTRNTARVSTPCPAPAYLTATAPLPAHLPPVSPPTPFIPAPVLAALAR